MVGRAAAGGGEVIVPPVECGEQAGKRVGGAAGGVGEPPCPRREPVGLPHLAGRVGAEGGHDAHAESRRRDPATCQSRSSAGSSVVPTISTFMRSRMPRAVSGAGRELPVGLVPDRLGGRRLEQVLDAEVTAELEVGPVEERIPERVRHRLRPGLELLPRRGRPRDPLLGHAVGPHRPPLVVVAREPGRVQVLEPPVGRDVLRAQVAVVVDDRTAGGDPVVEVGRRRIGEQERLVAESHAAYRFASASRISRSSTTSSGTADSASVFLSSNRSFAVLISFTTAKIAAATSRKSTTDWMKGP